MKHKSTEKLFKLAYTDFMTGVNNRNAFEERLNCLRKNKDIRGLTVMCVDLNSLKTINDTYGHYTGDEALKIVSDCLKKTVGIYGDIYRTGGDEFVVISSGKMLGYISEFRDLITFENKSLAYKLSVSMAYVVYDYKFNDDIDLMIKHCDSLMYADKKKQR